MKEIFLGTALALAAFVAVVILSVRFIKENGWDWGALPAYLMALIAMGASAPRCRNFPTRRWP